MTSLHGSQLCVCQPGHLPRYPACVQDGTASSLDPTRFITLHTRLVVCTAIIGTIVLVDWMFSHGVIAEFRLKSILIVHGG